MLEKQEILDKIKEYADSCTDLESSLKCINYQYSDDLTDGNPVGWRNFVTQQSISFTKYAETQLLHLVGIPGLYFHRCPSSLKRDNFNFWITQTKDKNVLFRKHGEEIRAILSTRFNTELDDSVLFPLVFGLLEEVYGVDLPGIQFTNFQKESDLTKLDIMFTAIQTEDMSVGLSIVNSEIGRSAIWIRPYISHGKFNFSSRSEEGCLSIRHTSDLDKNKIYAAINSAKKVAQVGVYRLLETKTEVVINPIQTIRQLVDDDDYMSDKIVNILEKEYKDRVDATKFELAKSMLVVIADLPLFQRYKMEQSVGQYLDLFSDTEERLTSINKNLQKLYVIEQ